MALIPLNVPAFPSVPNLPGVPALLRQVGTSSPLPVILLADALGLNSIFPPAWGILTLSGRPVLIGDCVVALDFHRDYRNSTHPIEEGSFSTYNKVELPFEIRVTYAISKADADRSNFSAACEKLIKSLDLYTVVSPDVVYTNVNAVRYGYRRDAKRGAGMLLVDIWLENVRIVAAARYTKGASTSGADAENNGTEQTTTLSSPEVGAHGALGPS